MCKSSFWDYLYLYFISLIRNRRRYNNSHSASSRSSNMILHQNAGQITKVVPRENAAPSLDVGRCIVRQGSRPHHLIIKKTERVLLGQNQNQTCAPKKRGSPNSDVYRGEQGIAICNYAKETMKPKGYNSQSQIQP